MLKHTMQLPDIGIKEPKDYYVTVRITDKQMKPQHLTFTDTKQRIAWDEEIEVNDVSDKTEAELAVIFEFAKTWSPKRYYINVVEIREKLIQVPRFIS